MAILIPSKNIYSKKNEKIKSNIIKRADFNIYKVEKEIRYNTNIYDEEINNFVIEQTKYRSDLGKTFDKYISGNKYFIEAFAYYQCYATWINIPSIKIKKINYNRKVQKLVSGNENGDYLVANLQYVETQGIAEGEITYGNQNIDSNGYISDDYINNSTINNVQTNYNDETNKNIYGEIPEIDLSYSYTYDAGVGFSPITAIAELGSPFFKIDGDITYFETEEEYIFSSFKLMCSSEIVKLSYGTDHYNADGIKNLPTSRIIEGTCIKRTPTQLTINIKGNAVFINLIKGTIIAGDMEDENSISIESNELTQYTNYFQNDDFYFEKDNYYNEIIGYEVIKNYENGKETATIRCSISDYYDYDSGEKLISIDNSVGKMSFKLYDQVIPMVYGADGKDYPMSKYKDGAPKIFQVLGTKIYYDGAVWQELSLQEI